MLADMSGLYKELVIAFAFAVPIIIALVNAIKMIFELEGKILVLVSFLVGVGLALLFALAYFMPAATPYVAVVFFVLAAGLVASGLYDFATRLTDGE